MNFHLSGEQIELQEAIGRYMRETLDGKAARDAWDSDVHFNESLWRGLAGLGLCGIAVSEEYGGLGLGLVEAALAAEVLGEHAAPSPFLSTTLAALAIEAEGSPEQKAKWLPRIASGELIATVALAEAGDAWHPDSWTVDSNKGTITGKKTAVECAEGAGLFVVGTRGGALSVVVPERVSVSVTPLDVADRSRRLSEIRFETAVAEPLGASSSAAGAHLLAQACVLIAADAFGGARKCIEMTVEYAKTRTQFGVPIGSFQGIKHRLADLACEVEPARALYWYAASAFKNQQPDRLRVASLAKAHLAEAFNNAARTAVELHGGIGFTWEFGLHMWVKRAMFDLAFAGTPFWHRRWAMQSVLAMPATVE